MLGSAEGHKEAVWLFPGAAIYLFPFVLSFVHSVKTQHKPHSSGGIPFQFIMDPVKEWNGRLDFMGGPLSVSILDQHPRGILEGIGEILCSECACHNAAGD